MIIFLGKVKLILFDIKKQTTNFQKKFPNMLCCFISALISLCFLDIYSSPGCCYCT